MFDNIVPANDSPFRERVRTLVRGFATWQPALKSRTPEADALAASAAFHLGGVGVQWVAPMPGPTPLPLEVTPFWMYGTFDQVRGHLSDRQWEELERSSAVGGAEQLVDTLTTSQLEWFEHGNVHALRANLEELVKSGICVGMLGASLGEELTTLLADLLELWSRGIYVVGIYRSRQLVLLHGADPEVARRMGS